MISCRLQSVQICDFKSYKDLITLNDFKQFTAIIGPNGCGKSNFMDAVGFAFGENNKALRVNNLSELIHGSNVGKPVSDQCFVKLVFLLEVQGTESQCETKSFKRILTTASSQETCRYEINDKAVSSEEYQAGLNSIGIHNRGKNALVFQGNIGSIAIETPKERCAYFERICGSKQFENEYITSKLEMEKAQKNVKSAFEQLKIINHELKNISIKKANIKTLADLEEKERTFERVDKLFKLFHIDKDLEEVNITFEAEIGKVQEYNNKRSEAEDQLDELKDDIKNKKQINIQIKQKIQKHETDLSDLKLEITENEENVHYLNQKMDRNLKSLKVAEKKCESYQIRIEDLKENVNLLGSKLADHYADTPSSKSDLQGRTRSLTDEQFEEYSKLKVQAKVQTSSYEVMLTSKKRELEKYQATLKKKLIKKTNCEERIRFAQENIALKYEESNSLKVKLDTLNNSILQKENYRDNFEKEIAEAQQKLPGLQDKKEKITEILKEAQLSQKRFDALSRLSIKFSGVKGRVFHLCKPKDKRYSVALEKIFREYANIIVVDKAETAKKCTQYLKDNKMDREMFTPLDEINSQDIPDICESLRDIPNVHLAYDLIKFPSDIDLVVKAITQNTLICEDIKDAQRLSKSRETEKGRLLGHTCVTVNGVKFDKYGLISFGNRSLVDDATKLEEIKIPLMESRMSEVIVELVDVQQKIDEEFKIKYLNAEIESLKTTIKFMQFQSEMNVKKRQLIEAELPYRDAEKERISNEIQEITDVISKLEIEISDITEKMNNIEDNVFENFCKEFGYGNIREYENKDLGRPQKKLEHIQQLRNHLKRVKDSLKSNESDYLNGMEEASQWKKNIAQTQAELKKANEDKSVLHEMIRKIESKLENERSKLKKVEAEIEEMKNKGLNLKKIIERTTKKIDYLKQNFAESKLDLELNRINMLRDCQINEIQIPLKSGSLSSFDLIEGSTEEHDIEIDYSDLPEAYKDRERIEEIQQELTEQMNEIQECLNRITFTLEKIDEKHLTDLKEQKQKANEKHIKCKQTAHRLMKRFEIVKKKRVDMFNSFMHAVSDIIDNIYKTMTKSAAAQAFLCPENPEEPYLGGIIYNCIPPGKKVSTTMEGLSGGEKTLASLTLLYAMQKVKPAPFFLLDEVDAALDPTNIKKLSDFIKDEKKSLQFIVISLKKSFFSEADTLVGVTENDELGVASGVYVFDLQKYERNVSR